MLTVMVKPVSGLCNMRCSYCFYVDEMQHRSTGVRAQMSLETLENLLRRAFAYAKDGLMLAFQGGEPTLAGAPFYQAVLALERRYNRLGVAVTHALQSNGLAMEDALLAVLREGRFLVGLSVDGTREIHDSRRVDAAGRGTYDRVMDTAARLRAQGIDYNILCVVDGAVARRGAEVFESLRPHRYLQFIPCLDPLEGPAREDALTGEDFGRFLCEIYPRYARLLRDGQEISVRTLDNWLQMLAGYPPENCGMLGLCLPNYLVESNGDVYPCDFYALDEWRMGNINEQSFFRLARSPVQAAFCGPLWADAACAACPYAFLCHGGCRRYREPLTDGAGRNRLCEGYRLFFDAYLPDMRALSAELLGPGVKGRTE